MKSKHIFAVTAAFLLFGCTALTTVATGLGTATTVASQSSIDERALLGAEVSYKAARTLMEAAVDAGQVKPKLAGQFYQVNGKLNAALVRGRIAYDTLNGAGVTSAVAQAAPLITEMWKLVAEQGKSDGL